MFSNELTHGIIGNCLFPIHKLGDSNSPNIKNKIVIVFIDFTLFSIKLKEVIL